MGRYHMSREQNIVRIIWAAKAAGFEVGRILEITSKTYLETIFRPISIL